MAPRRRNNEPLIIRCAGGTFTLQLPLDEALRAAAPNGLIYMREDEDMLTISATRVADARRRHLHPSYRLGIFRDVVKLAVIDMTENLRIMPVEWRKRSSERRAAAFSID